MINDFDAVALALTEDGKFPPVPKYQASVPPRPRKKSQREHSPFDDEDIIPRFSDFLHQLCAGMLEYLLRLSFVVARLSKSGRGHRYRSDRRGGVISSRRGGF